MLVKKGPRKCQILHVGSVLSVRHVETRPQVSWWFNSLTPGRCGNNFGNVFSDSGYRLNSCALLVKLLSSACHTTAIYILPPHKNPACLKNGIIPDFPRQQEITWGNKIFSLRLLKGQLNFFYKFLLFSFSSWCMSGATSLSRKEKWMQLSTCPLNNVIFKGLSTLNMLNCFKAYQRCIRISYHILDVVQQKTKFTMDQVYLLSILCCQYHACSCPGDFRSQGTIRHGIDPEPEYSISNIREEFSPTLCCHFVEQWIST